MMTGGGATCQLKALIEVLAPFTPAGRSGGWRALRQVGRHLDRDGNHLGSSSRWVGPLLEV
jgi:hypothetical protein